MTSIRAQRSIRRSSVAPLDAQLGFSGGDIAAQARDLWAFIRARFSFNPLSWGAAALVFVGAFLLDMRQLGSASLWFDETYSIGISHQPVAYLLKFMLNNDPNMALYYLLLHVWQTELAKFGVTQTEVIARTPSVFFGALGSVAIFALGRRFGGWTTGVVAAALYSFSNYALLAAQQARSYAMVMCWIIIAGYMLFGALNESERRWTRWWWSGYTLAMTLALYAQLLTVFVIAAHMLGVVALLVIPGPWRANARQNLRQALIGLMAIIILILPLIYGATHSGGSDWVQPATPKDAYNVLLDQLSDGSSLFLIIQCVVIGCGVGLALYAWLNPEIFSHIERLKHSEVASWRVWRLREPRPGITLLLLWTVFPFVVMYAITQLYLNLHFFFSRYEMLMMPGVALLLGLSVSLLPWPPLQWLLSAMLVTMAVVNLPYYYKHAQIQDFRTPITWLEARYQPGDGIICYPNDLCSIPVQAELNAYPSPARFDADSPGAYSWSDLYSLPVTIKTVSAYAARHPTGMFYVDAHLGGTNANSPTIDAAILAWLGARYTLRDKIVTSNVTVYYYTSGPPGGQ